MEKRTKYKCTAYFFTIRCDAYFRTGALDKREVVLEALPRIHRAVKTHGALAPLRDRLVEIDDRTACLTQKRNRRVLIGMRRIVRIEMQMRGADVVQIGPQWPKRDDACTESLR